MLRLNAGLAHYAAVIESKHFKLTAAEKIFELSANEIGGMRAPHRLCFDVDLSGAPPLPAGCDVADFVCLMRVGNADTESENLQKLMKELCLTAAIPVKLAKVRGVCAAGRKQCKLSRNVLARHLRLFRAWTVVWTVFQCFVLF